MFRMTMGFQDIEFREVEFDLLNSLEDGIGMSRID